MTKVVIIGGTGHVGSYLVPRLVERGYEVTNVSRGTSKPYKDHPAWKKVNNAVIDRAAEEEKGTFGDRIVKLGGDIVIDMITFDPKQAEALVTALQGKVDQYIFCSTVWVYGYLQSVPASETDPIVPIDDYGGKKLAIEQLLMRKARRNGFPATSFRPGHIVGEGWNPINPLGNANPKVFETIAKGETLTLPEDGRGLLHHVHADDCAQWVMCAIDNRAATIGECFNTVSNQALNLRGYAEAMYRYFGHEPKLAMATMDEWRATIDKTDGDNSWAHIRHSTCCSSDKSKRLIGYSPHYTSLESIQESVQDLIRRGVINA